MKILFSTNGQIRDVLGEERISLELPEHAGLSHVLEKVLRKLDQKAQMLLVDEKNKLQPGLMIIVNDEMVFEEECLFKDGDSLCILMPMSGG